MKFILLWLLFLAAYLLFAASVYAVYGRTQKRVLRWLLELIVGLPLALPFFLFVLHLGWYYFFSSYIEPRWLPGYTGFLSVTILVGYLLIKRRGRKKEGEVEAWSRWPLGRLWAAFGIVLGLFIAALSAVDSDVRAQIAAVQSKTDALAMTVMPAPVSDSRNAALVYEKAYKALGSYGKLPKWLGKDSQKPWFDPKNPEAVELLEKNRKALALAKQGAAMQDYYLPIKFRFDYPIPMYSNPQNVARLLALDARAKAADGEIDASMENIVAMHRIAEHISRTPNLIAVMVASDMESKATATLENVLAQTASAPLNIASLRVENSGYLRKAFRRSLVGEDVSHITNIIEIYSGMGRENSDAGSVWFRGALYRIFFAPYDIDFHTRYWREFGDFASKPFYETRERYKELSEFVEENPGSVYYSLMAAFGGINYSHYGIKFAEAEAGLALSNLALAATAYRAGHGGYPATLDDLAPDYIKEIPTDPFDGKPIKMAVVEGGVVLYSVGKDEKDDGGAELDSAKEKGDITFVLGLEYAERRRAGIAGVKVIIG
jgi:hypothetical protein